MGIRSNHTIKINFRGGIISPGDLYNILVVARKAGVLHVSFGLRQQLLLNASADSIHILREGLGQLAIPYDLDNEQHPNIVSSYPAEEIFITNTWLSEGVYKDIFDGLDYEPELKINVSDSHQSFTPMLTGNINWVASATSLHFWHLFIRFPKTNSIYEWNEMVYTNDIPGVSKEIEKLIFQHREAFYDNKQAKGEALMQLLQKQQYITKPAEKPAALPAFNLPYYEGVNRVNDKYWVGIYRRDELFAVDFLKALCKLCLDTKIGQLCSTPWKSIIIKGVEEKDRPKWNQLLNKYQVNMRHAANELNFQVEDHCREGLELKNYLVKKLNDEDTRTFGVCIGIKTRKKSEVFCSVLVRRRPLINLWGLECLYVYDILCAHDFNPNARTGFVFSRANPKFLLGEQLRRLVIAFYNNRADKNAIMEKQVAAEKAPELKKQLSYVHQCRHCFTIYDESFGDLEKGAAPGTAFESLDEDYHCPLCDADKSSYTRIEKAGLELQTI